MQSKRPLARLQRKHTLSAKPTLPSRNFNVRCACATGAVRHALRASGAFDHLTQLRAVGQDQYQTRRSYQYPRLAPQCQRQLHCDLKIPKTHQYSPRNRFTERAPRFTPCVTVPIVGKRGRAGGIPPRHTLFHPTSRAQGGHTRHLHNTDVKHTS